MDSSKLKPFNLELALSGASVVTRDGSPVTQLHVFSLPNDTRVAGVINTQVVLWPVTGRVNSNGNTNYDLFMAPVKKTGWFAHKKPQSDSLFMRHSSSIYRSEEEAKARFPDDQWIIQEIEWFE
jgi:hypothetical protein